MQNFLSKHYSPLIIVPLIGVLSAYYFGLTGALFAVTGEFTRWGGHILSFFGIDPLSYTYLNIIGFKGGVLDRGSGIMIVGMFLGAFVAALLSNNVKLRLPTSPLRVAQAIIGGILAGFGARLAMGCNLAAFFTGIPQFSLHAWYFTVATIAGTWVGAKIIKNKFFASKVKLTKCTCEYAPKKQEKNSKNKFLIFLSFVVIAFIMWDVTAKKEIFALMLIFGLMFGFLLEKGQVCFTSAFRDLWLAGRSSMAVAIVVAMMIGAIGTYAFIEAGVSPKIHWAGLNASIGGFIFGIGIVIAGGCETGWMYRAVEGQTHYWFVGIGNIIGTILLVLVWDKIGFLATDYPKINLISEHKYAGLIATYLGLIAMLGFIFWYEKVYFKRIKNEN